MDAFNLVTAVRHGKKAIGIVALVSTTEKNPPLDLFKAGVDNFILKRAGFVSLLQDALNQAKERHQANPSPHTRQVRLLYAGDIQTIQKNASSSAANSHRIRIGCSGWYAEASRNRDSSGRSSRH